MFRSTKTYCHNIGLSCCFRQWRATHSHCSKLHGYALQVSFVFKSPVLDERNWVLDFGGMKEVKAWLEETFDHKTVVSQDDPQLDAFLSMEREGVIDLAIVPAVGCEMFAKLIYAYASAWMIEGQRQGKIGEGVVLESVEVREHGANSAIYSEE